MNTKSSNNALFISEFKKLILIIIIGLIVGYIVYKPIYGVAACLLGYCVYTIQIAIRYRDSLRRKNFRNLPYNGQLLSEISDDMIKIAKKQKKLTSNLAKQVKSQKKLLDSWPDGMIIIDDNLIIHQYNKNAGIWLGLEPVDKGRYINNIVRDQELIHLLKRIGVAEDDDQRIYMNRIRMFSPSDSLRQLQVRLADFVDGYYLLIFRDITNIENIQRMRKDFLENASHELKSPLTAIKGFSEMIYDDLAEDNQSKIAMDHIIQQSNRMDEIIKDLLVLSKLESSSTPNYNKQVNVPQIIDENISYLSNLNADIRFICNIDNAFDIVGNSKEVTSIISNLLNNAIRHNAADCEITVSWQLENEKACLIVKDNGVGVNAEFVSQLTERFFRPDSGRARENGGTGLGLAIVKHSVQRHQGNLVIKSDLNEGMEVKCTFPKQRVRAIKTT